MPKSWFSNVAVTDLFSYVNLNRSPAITYCRYATTIKWHTSWSDGRFVKKIARQFQAIKFHFLGQQIRRGRRRTICYTQRAHRTLQKESNGRNIRNCRQSTASFQCYTHHSGQHRSSRRNLDTWTWTRLLFRQRRLLGRIRITTATGMSTLVLATRRTEAGESLQKSLQKHFTL